MVMYKYWHKGKQAYTRLCTVWQNFDSYDVHLNVFCPFIFWSLAATFNVHLRSLTCVAPSSSMKWSQVITLKVLKIVVPKSLWTMTRDRQRALDWSGRANSNTNTSWWKSIVSKPVFCVRDGSWHTTSLFNLLKLPLACVCCVFAQM